VTSTYTTLLPTPCTHSILENTVCLIRTTTMRPSVATLSSSNQCCIHAFPLHTMQGLLSSISLLPTAFFFCLSRSGAPLSRRLALTMFQYLSRLNPPGSGLHPPLLTSQKQIGQAFYPSTLLWLPSPHRLSARPPPLRTGSTLTQVGSRPSSPLTLPCHDHPPGLNPGGPLSSLTLGPPSTRPPGHKDPPGTPTISQPKARQDAPISRPSKRASSLVGLATSRPSPSPWSGRPKCSPLEDRAPRFLPFLTMTLRRVSTRPY